MTDIVSMTLPELREFLNGLGEKSFRAGQIYSWIHQKKAVSYEEMTNLSKELRRKLSEEAPLRIPEIEDLQISRLDGTRKYLFRLSDGNLIESVLMKYHYGNSVCISSQAGCRMGCRFCASTIGGLDRSLTAGEMLEQVYQIERETGERVSHVVVMGTGEPLDNYDSLLRFLRMITDEKGLHISQRNITVSTSGIVPRIYDLAGEHLEITLAVSLHASTQEKRETLMPIAKKYGIHEVVKAADDYSRTTGRRVTFEYSLVSGVNDTDEDAEELGHLLHGILCHVNLIPVNPIRERSFAPSDRSRVLAFQKKLEKKGIHVTIRRELGRDIDGACGQLRRRHMKGIQE